VARDSGEQSRLGPGAILGMPVWVVEGWLDGRPRRSPQRIDAGLLIEDLGDVPAFAQNGNPQVVVFESHRAAATPSHFSFRISSIASELAASAAAAKAQVAGVSFPAMPQVLQVVL